MDTARPESGDVAVAAPGTAGTQAPAKRRRPAPLRQIPSRYSIIVV